MQRLLPCPPVLLQPARPALGGYRSQISPTGSTPNLLGMGSPYWAGTVPGRRPMDTRTGFNTLAHPGRQGHQPTPLSRGQPQTGSMSVLPTGGSYAASMPTDPQPLGYIVAYTPDQLAGIMKDNYPMPPHLSGSQTRSASVSPNRPSSGYVSGRTFLSF